MKPIKLIAYNYSPFKQEDFLPLIMEDGESEWRKRAEGYLKLPCNSGEVWSLVFALSVEVEPL